MTAPTNSNAETTPSRAVVVSDACSALRRAARRLFERENARDDAALWDWIVAGKPLPEKPAGDRVRFWAWKRWGDDYSKDFAGVPSIEQND